MNTEQIIAIALPHSVAAEPHDGFHVSVFLSPKLFTDQAEAQLGDFPTLRDWARLVHGVGGIDLELVSQNGAIPAQRLDLAVPDDWAALFPADTPVAGTASARQPQTVPDWSGKLWASYPAAETAGYAQSLLLSTILADPVTPVPPRQHPLADPILTYFGRHKGIHYDDPEAPRPLPPVPPSDERKWRGPEWDEYRRAREAWQAAVQRADAWYAEFHERIGFPTDNPQGIDIREAELTAHLDDQRANRQTRSALAGLAPNASPYAQVTAALSDLHESRRFFEEPDPAPDGSRIVPQQEPLPLPPRAPEFHERVAAAGDHPELLRRLGLVIDVTADPAQLRSADWLAVRMRAQNAPGDLVRSPRVRVRALDDDTFVVLPHQSRQAEWQDGRLALGDTDRFRVLDVDPDGSALKTERFVMSLPRMLKVQANNDPIDAAAPALRATGLAVTRTGQLAAVQEQFDRQVDFQTGLAAAPAPEDAPEAFAHDVTRGIRVEVYDATAGRWHSLHRRLSTVVLGRNGDRRTAYADHEEDGFLQGTAAHETPDAQTPTVKIHESVFGWDGWSLSVERPGNRIRPEVVRNHDDTAWTVEEHVEPPDTEVPGQTPPHPFVASFRIARRTLPRLRYGRRYAFRAWIVDLAGNVRPHALTVEAPDPARIRGLLVPRRVALVGELEARRRPQVAEVGLRTAALEVVAERAARSATARVAASVIRERLGSALTEAVTARADAAPLATAELGVSDAFVEAVGELSATAPRRDLGAPVRAAAARLDPSPQTRTAPPELLDEVARLAATLLGSASPSGAAVQRALQGATALRPFLRWDPVPPPAVVARAELTEAESLRVLVVRSGVTQTEPGAEVVVTPPAVYAPEAETAVEAADPSAPAGAPFFRERSERHLVAPKTSQQQAELHGEFDGSLDGRPGRTSPADRAAIRTEELAWALRESGTLFDRRRAPLDSPTGPWLAQDGVRLVIPPSAAERLVADSAGALPVPAPAPTDADPVVPAGQAPPSGAYVVHDTDHVEIPYLPDPLAAGASLRFIDAGAGLRADPPKAVHVTTAPYEGGWPDRKPFRLLLAGGDVLDASVSGRDVEIQVPAGDTQRFTLASSIDDHALSRLGVWDALDDAFTTDPAVERAARDGLIWGLTPGELVTLVHAVPRPVAAARFGRVIAVRAAGQTRVAILGIAYVHGASTEQITAEARWTEIADAGDRGAQRRVATDVAFTTRILPHETAILTGVPIAVGDLQGHAATQTFADTRHRRVEYVLRATTRYREYFPPALLEPSGADQWPADDGKSVLSAPVVLDIPSSAPPPPPAIHSVIPLFRWEDAEEPEQPFARRRVRRSGVRIYLERGWFASGDGELLALLLGVAATPGAGDTDDAPFVSQWGNDPAWDGAMVAMRRLTQLQLQNVTQILDPDAAPQPGRPERFEQAMTVRPAADEAGAAPPPPATVALAAYRPRFSVARDLWYVDVVFEAAQTHWPFIRLALARYQPSSVAGCHLSTPVRADFVQLTPERVLTVGRPDEMRVSVSLLGEFGHRRLGDGNSPMPESQPVDVRDAAVAVSHRVVAKLQQRLPLVGGDLGWRTVDAVDLAIGGHGARDTQALWLGTIDLAAPLPLRRPLAQELDTTRHEVDDPEEVPQSEPLPDADSGIVFDPPSDWRVRVEEWEHIPSDPPAGQRDDDRRARNVWERRLVYADDVYL